MTHNVATPPVVNDSSSTAAEEARTAPDPPTHSLKDAPCTAAQQGRTAEMREFVHADVMLPHRIGIFMFFSPCFYDPSPHRRPGTGHFDAPRSPLTEFGVGARSFAGDPEGCCVGRAWRGRAAADGRVELGRAVPKRGILKQA